MRDAKDRGSEARSNRKRTTWLGLLCLWGLGEGALAQTTRLVPSQYATIQAAINASLNGDTVLVAPGTYVENINFLGKSIVVRSEEGPAVTAIDGGGLAIYVVKFVSGEGPGAVLGGFKVTGSISGGIQIDGSSPTIVGNLVQENTGCLNGIGILMFASSALVAGNVITQNTQSGCSGPEGGGIDMVADCSGAKILDNVISNNTQSSGGGLALSSAGSPLIQGNLVSGNTADLFSGGIGWANSTPRLIQNLFVGNTASSGGGGIAFSGVPASGVTVIANNTVVGNSCFTGSALFAQGGIPASVQIRNNVFSGPTAQTTVFAPSFTAGSAFSNNDVFGPGSTLYGGGMPSQTGLNGNFSSDPMFVDPSAGDFHLQPSSPCVDAGFNLVPFLPSTDPDGDARTQDGNADGTATIDVGRDEHVPALRFGSGCTGTFNLLPRIGVGGSPPALGNAGFGVLLTGAPGGTPSILVIALGLPSSPISLAPVNLPDCSLFVSPFLCLVTTTLGSGLIGGSSTTGMPIPSEPALQGQHFYFQAYAADSAGTLVPGALTVALDVAVQ